MPFTISRISLVLAVLAVCATAAVCGVGAQNARDGWSQLNAGAAWSGKGPAQLKEITSDGIQRQFFLYVPSSAQQPAPLVLAFHGGGGKAAGTDKCAGGLARLADEKGFVVAYPEGLDKHWNDGRPGLAHSYHNDVAFVEKIIDQLTAENVVDKKRVYATGISNGGFFSQYLSSQLPGKIAAVATVAASVSKSLGSQARPVPIMLLLGTEDTLVPWKGGEIGGRVLRHKRGEVLSGRDSLSFWLAVNKNSDKPVSTTLPDNDTTDGSTVLVEQYGPSGSANEVLFYEIKGGGHTWPSGQQYLPKMIIGPVCRDFDGNRAIWNFFEKHSLN